MHCSPYGVRGGANPYIQLLYHKNLDIGRRIGRRSLNTHTIGTQSDIEKPEGGS
jgi:hypothetical protein